MVGQANHFRSPSNAVENTNGGRLRPPGAVSPDRAVTSSGASKLLVLGVAAGVVLVAVANIVGMLRQNRTKAKYTPESWVSLEEPEKPAEAQPPTEWAGPPFIRVAIAPVVSPEKSLKTYQRFVDYLAARLDRRPLFLQGGTYAEVNDLVRYRRCEVALVCDYAFIRGEQEFGMEALVVPQIGGALTYHSLIVVPRSSRAASLLNLEGKRFASADVLSASGWLFPAAWLKEQGKNPNTFFGEHVITRSHDWSVLAVASGYVDGAAVDSLVYQQMTEEDPSVAERTRIILQSPPLGMPPVVVPPRLEPTLKERLRAVLLGMHTDPEGQKVLRSLRIDRFVVPDKRMFDSVRELAELVEAGR